MVTWGFLCAKWQTVGRWARRERLPRYNSSLIWQVNGCTVVLRYTFTKLKAQGSNPFWDYLSTRRPNIGWQGVSSPVSKTIAVSRVAQFCLIRPYSCYVYFCLTASLPNPSGIFGSKCFFLSKRTFPTSILDGACNSNDIYVSSLDIKPSELLAAGIELLDKTGPTTGKSIIAVPKYMSKFHILI